MMNTKGITCPLDGTLLIAEQGRLVCPNGHSFDLARQGYCHLLPVQEKRSADPGDSKAMVNARSDFLDAGLYQPIAELMIEQLVHNIAALDQVVIADAGCGEGYYLNALSQHLSKMEQSARLIGFDISKWAVARACRRNRDITWLVASNRNPPIAPDYIDTMLCMFGFPQYPAFAKCIKPGGYLLMLDGGPAHLIELREHIYEQVNDTKPFNAEPALSAGFERVSETRLTVPKVEIPQHLLASLLLMTPHFFRASEAAKEALLALPRISVTIDVECRVYQLKAPD